MFFFYRFLKSPSGATLRCAVDKLQRSTISTFFLKLFSFQKKMKNNLKEKPLKLKVKLRVCC